MPIMTWDESLSTKVKECDEQHIRLIGMINALHDSMKAGKGRDALGKVLADLLEYTVYHFGTEEQLFKEHGYPEAAVHVLAHETLTKQVKELKQKYESGNLSITVETMNFLRDWLKSHIMGMDKRYGSFLNGKGVH